MYVRYGTQEQKAKKTAYWVVVISLELAIFFASY